MQAEHQSHSDLGKSSANGPDTILCRSLSEIKKDARGLLLTIYKGSFDWFLHVTWGTDDVYIKAA
jgi:hypothetical protein